MFGPDDPYEIDDEGNVAAFVVGIRGKPPFGLAFDSRSAEEQADGVRAENGLEWHSGAWAMRPDDDGRIVRVVNEEIIFEITLFHMPSSVRDLIWSGDPRASEVANAFLQSAHAAISQVRLNDPNYDWFPNDDADDS